MNRLQTIVEADEDFARKWMRNNLLPADVVTERGQKNLSGAIRWFTRNGGEDRSWGNHSGIIGVTANYIQALSRVVECPVLDWRFSGELEIHRYVPLDSITRVRVAQAAEGYIGRRYGTFKIGAHAIDGFLGKVLRRDVYLARRFCLMERYPICSWIVSWAYKRIPYAFLGKDPRAVTPDDIHDDVTRSEDWVRVVKRFLGGRFDLARPF